MKNFSILSHLFMESAFPGCEDIDPKPESINWYKKLSLHQRINAKDCFELLCGAEWSIITKVLGLRLTIDVMYNKLKMEGFQV